MKSVWGNVKVDCAPTQSRTKYQLHMMQKVLPPRLDVRFSWLDNTKGLKKVSDSKNKQISG
jgi:hypothetical protein